MQPNKASKFIKIALSRCFSPLAYVFTDAFNAEQKIGIFGVKDDISYANSSQVQALRFANGGGAGIWLRRHAGQFSAQVLSAK